MLAKSNCPYCLLTDDAFVIAGCTSDEYSPNIRQKEHTPEEIARIEELRSKYATVVVVDQDKTPWIVNPYARRHVNFIADYLFERQAWVGRNTLPS